MDGGAAVKIIGWAAVTVDHGEIVDVAEYPAGQRSQAEEAVALWDGMDPIEENRSPTEQNLLVALVPVADLPEPVDVDAAVERAARAYFSQSHEGAWEDQPSPAWVAAACRDHVRPIVLAALGLSPDQP